MAAAGGRRSARMGKSSAERATQSWSPGAGVARQGAARARWHAEMLAGDRRAEARLGRRREPLHASRGRGGRGRGGGGAGGGLSGAGPGRRAGRECGRRGWTAPRRNFVFPCHIEGHSKCVIFLLGRVGRVGLRFSLSSRWRQRGRNTP